MAKRNVKNEGEATAAKAANVGVTEDTIRAAIDTAMTAIADIHEPELRVRGDNRKLYRVDENLPAGVEREADEEVNRFAYLVGQLTNGLTWKLETMLHDQFERLQKSERTLAYMKQESEHGRRSEREVETAQNWVDRFEEQVEVLAIAFDQAQAQHELLLGKPFTTKAERDARAIARKRVAQSAPRKSEAIAKKYGIA